MFVLRVAQDTSLAEISTTLRLKILFIDSHRLRRNEILCRTFVITVLRCVLFEIVIFLIYDVVYKTH